jgi:ABC-2 type transport system ATP-binding protein
LSQAVAPDRSAQPASASTAAQGASGSQFGGSGAEPAIRVRDLRKTFFVPVREGGLRAAVTSLVRRKTKAVTAVDGVSFDIEPGEVVGFLGPNGAGKTTTLKMLSGLLYPTSGEVTVLGHVPSKREPAYLRQITMVMGNRNQLQWDLPALDSYELLRAIYRLHPDDFRKTRDEFVELLDLGDLVRKPVRNLSLGERMKVETAAALLHRPQVLFLDEPTIGLDVTMQKRIRSFVAEYNARYGATVLLTSHYMADVQALCKRVIVIHHGRILFDGELATLANRFGADKTIGVTLKEGAPEAIDFSPYGEVLGREDGKVSLKVGRGRAPEVAGRLLRDLPVADLTIEDPPIEDVIESVFASG